MKNSNHTSRDLDALQARFALRVAARLSESATTVPHDVSERLRVARDQALARARERRSVEVRTSPSVQVLGSGRSAVLGLGGSPWWLKLASLVPLVMLVVGLSVIEDLHSRSQIDAAAEIDSALLADSLPPDAYRDPGFVEFLKTAQE